MVRPGVTAIVSSLTRLSVPGRPLWCHSSGPEVCGVYLSSFAGDMCGDSVSRREGRSMVYSSREVVCSSTSPPKLSVADQYMQHLQHDTHSSDLMWNSTDDGQKGNGC